MFIVLLVLGAFAAPPARADVATPFASPVAETVLYEANAVEGFEEWELAGGWSLQNGMLVHSDPINRSTIVAPIALDTLDYAIELEVRAADWNSYWGAFGVTARVGSEFEVSGSVGPREGVAVWINNEEIEWDKVLLAIPDSGWLTLRLEVKGTSIRLLLNGSVAIDIIDDRLVGDAPGQVALWSYPDVQVEVRSFRVLGF